MQRQIFIVAAYIVDANGTFNALSGYPKTFDSRNYGNDIDKTLLRAQGEYHDTLGAFCKRDDRQLQTVMLMSADGFVLNHESIGRIADIAETQE